MISNIDNQDNLPLKPAENSRPVEQNEKVNPAAGPPAEAAEAAAPQRLAEDSIEISDAARRKQVEQKNVEEEKSREENDLQFTGNHFYTLGLNLIKQEAIASPSEPEIKP